MKLKRSAAIALLLISGSSLSALAQSSGLPQSPAPAGAKAYFVNLENGAKVKSPFKGNCSPLCVGLTRVEGIECVAAG